MPSRSITPNAPASSFEDGSHGHLGDEESIVIYDYGDDLLNEDGSSSGLMSNMSPVPSGSDPYTIVPSGNPSIITSPVVPVSDSQAPQI